MSKFDPVVMALAADTLPSEDVSSESISMYRLLRGVRRAVDSDLVSKHAPLCPSKARRFVKRIETEAIFQEAVEGLFSDDMRTRTISILLVERTIPEIDKVELRRPHKRAMQALELLAAVTSDVRDKAHLSEVLGNVRRAGPPAASNYLAMH